MNYGLWPLPRKYAHTLDLFVAVTAAAAATSRLRPVLVGGDGPGVLDRVLAFGDAWFPNHAPESVLERARELRARADRPVGLMVMGVPADPGVVEAYARAGFSRAVHWLPSAPRGPVQRAFDVFEAAIAEFDGS